MSKVIDTLILAGLLQVREVGNEVRITLCVPLAGPPTIQRAKSQKLGGLQRTIFKMVHNLIDNLSGDRTEVAVSDIYDGVIVQLPPPPQGKRDRRSECMRRALHGLHEKGLVVITDGSVRLGSAFISVATRSFL